MKDLIFNQFRRLQSKGKYYFVAVLFNILIYIVFRQIASFYWPYIVNNFTSDQIYLNLLYLSALFAHIINQLFYYSIWRFGLFQDSLVTIESSKLPWISDKENWKKLRWRSIKIQFINIVIVSYGLLYLTSYINQFKYSIQLPSQFQMISHLYVCIFMESITFFILHWLAHQYFYSIHKVHHQFTIAHPFATNHFHPLQYIVGVLVPFASGTILLGRNMHILEYMLWTFWRIGESYDNHSNYEFKWSIFRIWPFSASSSYHSFHHTHNVGTYGSNMVIFDQFTNNTKQFYDFVNTKKKSG